MLRFIAFLAVFTHHFGDLYPKLTGFGYGHDLFASIISAGALGTDLFFCLSAFLITSLLLREYEEKGTFSLKKFWIRRTLRIWPLYFFFLGLGLFVFPQGLTGQPNPGYEILFATFCGNWAYVLKIWNGFTSPMVLLWSICVEEQFYFMWPILLLWFTPKRIVPMTLVGFGVATLTRIIIIASHFGPWNPVIWMNTLARIDPIAAGILFALVINRRGWFPTLFARVCLGFAGVALPIGMIFLSGNEDVYGNGWSVIFYPIVALSSVAIIAALYREESDSKPISRTLVKLGRISYGLYVYHLLFIWLSGNFCFQFDGDSVLVQTINGAIRFGWIMMVTVLVAWLSYELLELPFLKLKEKRFTNVPSAPVDVS